MAYEFDTEPNPTPTQVICLECGAVLGGDGQPDPYKHMLHCLNVEPDAVERIKEVAKQNGNENGKRVIHICDFILGRR